MKNIAFVILGFSLISCTSVQESSSLNTRCDEGLSYCVELPSDMSQSLWKPSVSFSGESTAHTASNGPPFDRPESVRVEVFHKGNCDLLGASNTRSIASGVWGLIDFWSNREHVMDLQNEYPVCRPPSSGIAYAFCAEKDGKAVAICIQQMTDDEDIARKIFESFRWTD